MGNTKPSGQKQHVKYVGQLQNDWDKQSGESTTILPIIKLVLTESPLGFIMCFIGTHVNNKDINNIKTW